MKVVHRLDEADAEVVPPDAVHPPVKYFRSTWSVTPRHEFDAGSVGQQPPRVVERLRSQVRPSRLRRRQTRSGSG